MTCLHIACYKNVFTDSLHLLLEYLSKHTDIKKMLEERDNDGWTCLHCACLNNLSTNSLRLLISFFPSNDSLQLVLGSENNVLVPPLHLAGTEARKQLLQDPDCWQKCRFWLFCNYQDTFLNSLYPNSPETTLESLKDLGKNYADDETLKKAILFQQNFVERFRLISQDASARQALELTALSTIVLFHEDFINRDYITQREKIEARQLITNFRKLKLLSEEERDREELELAALSTTEDFHRSHIIQQENSEVQRLIADLQTQVLLSRDEVDRQELEKLIFDRSSRDRFIEQVIPLLVENHVTRESFFLLNENDLREMGVKIGPRKQLLQIIEQETLRRGNLSARSDISSRPRSPGHTPRILGGVPPLALSASALIQRHQEQQLVPSASKDSEEQQRSFVATTNSEVVSVNGGSESYNSGPTAKS